MKQKTFLVKEQSLNYFFETWDTNEHSPGSLPYLEKPLYLKCGFVEPGDILKIVLGETTSISSTQVSTTHEFKVEYHDDLSVVAVPIKKVKGQ